MAAMAPNADFGDSHLTQDFNDNSFGKFFKHVAKHVLVMGAMMGVIGLAGMPALAAGPLAFPGAETALSTPGDLIVQTAYGAGEMLNMIVDTLGGILDIGGDVVSNTLSGEWAPTTYENLASHGGMAHGAGMEGMAHGVHGADAVMAGHDGGAMDAAYDEWLRNAHASGELPYALEDSEMAGMTLEEYMASEYGHDGH